MGPDLWREQLEEADGGPGDHMRRDRSPRPHGGGPAAQPPTTDFRNLALQRADEAMGRISSSAHGLTADSDAVAKLIERADVAADIISGLRAGSRRDLGLGLVVAIALSEIVEHLEDQLPAEAGALLMTTSADVLDALSDLAALGPDGPNRRSDSDPAPVQ